MRVEVNRAETSKDVMPTARTDSPNSRYREMEQVKDDAQLREADKQNSRSPELENAINKIDKTVRIFNKSLHFTKHEASGRIMVKVIDTETHKVIREIPPEEILDIVAKLDEMVGLLVDERR